MHSTPHRHFLAGVIFNFFEKEYGIGELFHGHIKDKSRHDFFEQKVVFKGLKLRFCMFIDHDVRLLTVFDENQKTATSQGKILSLMSSLSYTNDASGKSLFKEEIQHFYHNAPPSEEFIAAIHSLLGEDSNLQSLWPRKTSDFLKVA